jgi:hypothetical protein
LPFRTEKGEKEKFSQSSFSDVKKMALLKIIG